MRLGGQWGPLGMFCNDMLLANYFISHSFFCSCDYVKIINDKNTTVGVYCGSITGQELRLNGGQVVIIFHSDYSLQERGFQIVFSFSPVCK